MIKKLLKQAKGYELQSILTVIFVLLETALEVILPLFMSNILNSMQLYATQQLLTSRITYLDWSTFTIATLAGSEAAGVAVTADAMRNIVITYGVLMVLSAVCSLTLGSLAGKFCADAGAGFSKNVRKALFGKIQDFSFSNVDKFSTASLVTRSTTDVNNAQQALSARRQC